MELIVLFPAFLAVLVCVLRSPAAAFLSVYLPVLLLIPDHFRWRVPGLPDPGFQHAAILPIAGILVFAQRARWRFTITDLLVLGYAAVIGFSEYRAAGWKDAQNLLFDQVCGVVLPYALAKLLIQPGGLEAAFARRFAACLALVAVLSIWEFRMGERLFFETLWGTFFPGVPQIPVQYRWGFGRIGGPYTHAILAGMIFGVGLFLQAWLLRVRAWTSRRAALAVLALVLLGTLLTMSRGPWLGILAGGCVAVLGCTRDRGQLALRLGLLVLVLALPLWQFMQEYTAVSSLRATNNEQQTAAYRAELLDAYLPKIWKEAEFGYGARRWPVDQRYSSIDNHYMLLALQHGIVAVAALAAIMLGTCLRLGRFALRRPPLDVTGGLAFTLFAAIVSVAVGIGTAYLGAQVAPVLFLLVGWSEGLVAYGSRRQAAGAAPAAPPALHSFRRVLT